MKTKYLKVVRGVLIALLVTIWFMGLEFLQLILQSIFPVSTQETLVLMDEIVVKILLLMMTTPFWPVVAEFYRLAAIVDQDPKTLIIAYGVFLAVYFVISTVVILYIEKKLRKGE